MFTTDEVIAAQKRNVDTLLGITQKSFENVEKVVMLNLQATKAAIEETRDALLSAKEPKDLFVAQADVFQPVAEKATAYSRELYEIASQANAELSKYAEESVVQARKQLLALIDSAVKNAPAGSESAASIFKTGVLAANEAFDSVQRLAKQASESVEVNVNALTAKAPKAGNGKGKRVAA
jgi:phasin family protein